MGPLAAAIDGETVALRPGRAQIVLARLALDGGRTVPREALIRSLWDDDPPASAVNVVQVAISSLRRRLGAEAIRSSPAGYALGPAKVDVLELLEDVRRGARAAEVGDDVAVGAALAPVLERFRTPLEDLGESRFVAETRRSVAERFLTAVELYSAAAIRSGRADTVVGLLPELVRAHPLREALLEQYVLALGAVGRETDAISAYDAGRLQIADELGVDPGTRLRAAYERVLRQDLPLQGAASVHRLRIVSSAPTDLIGRDGDRAELARLLERQGVRLVTMVGPAGIGKSRLAEAVAAEAGGSMADVAHASSADALAAAVVRAVVEPRPAGDPFSSLVQVLGQRRRTLLVLDGLPAGDHAAAFIEDLLAAVSGLQLVVTTRRPLHTPSEVRFSVPGVETGRRGDQMSPAAQLLADRMARERGGRRRDDDPELVEEIARLCDGIPLALELAAAASRVHSLRAVRDGLSRSPDDDADPWLEGSGALEAAMRSSLEGLPQDALALLRAAAFFVDGDDVPALAAVAGLEARASEAAAVEVRDRGLLVETGGREGLRLRLLGPIREAVLARTDRPRLDALRAAYVQHFESRYCNHDWYVRVPRTAAEVADITAESGNLQAALAMAAHLATPRLARMVARLAWASTVLTSGEAWRQRRDAALALPGVSDEDRFDLLIAASDGPAVLEEAGRIVRRMGDPSRVGWFRFREARMALDRGDVVAAQRSIDALAEVAHRDGSAAGPFLRARLLDVLQMLALRTGHPEESLELTDLAMGEAVAEGRLVEAELLEVVRIEVLIAGGRTREAADSALDLLERTADASPWIRGATVSLRGVALFHQGATSAAVDAQRTAVGVMLGSPWRIERLEVILRWAAAVLRRDPGDRDAAFVMGVWSAAMRRLDLAAWPIEQGLADAVATLDAPGAAAARRAGEQSVRLDGGDRAVEGVMRAILDGGPLLRKRG